MKRQTKRLGNHVREIRRLVKQARQLENLWREMERHLFTGLWKEQEEHILTLRLSHHLTPTEVASMLAVSPDYILRIERRAIAKLHKSRQVL